MKLAGYITALLCLLSTAAIAQLEGVVEISSDDFEAVIKTNRLVVVAFGASWCPFSQQLAVIWTQLSQVLVGDAYRGVIVAAVDSETERELFARHGVTKYPTIRTWKNGQQLRKEYRGARTIPHFKAYIDKMLSPSLVRVSNSSEAWESSDQKKAIIGTFKSENDPALHALADVAETMREYCGFYAGYSQEMQSLAPYLPYIMFKQAGQFAVYPATDDASNKEKLLEWTRAQCQPIVDEITFENGEELTEEGLPFLIMFTDPKDSESRQQFRNAVEKYVPHETHRIKFLVADGHQFEHPLHHMGKSRADLPVIAIDSFQHMYDFGAISNLDQPGRLQSFIDGLFSGELHRNFHSQRQESPPPSELHKLGPSQNRYSFQRDEL